MFFLKLEKTLMANQFTLRYSTVFYNDLDKIINYIIFDIKNEVAAIKLIDDVEAAIKKQQAFPLQSPIYQSINKREHPYRKIVVGNFLIFYVVINDMMIVRRILYGRRDLSNTV